eukprot:6490828-Amphidinium_carterae.1
METPTGNLGGFERHGLVQPATQLLAHAVVETTAVSPPSDASWVLADSLTQQGSGSQGAPSSAVESVHPLDSTVGSGWESYAAQAQWHPPALQSAGPWVPLLQAAPPSGHAWPDATHLQLYGQASRAGRTAERQDWLQQQWGHTPVQFAELTLDTVGQRNNVLPPPRSYESVAAETFAAIRSSRSPTQRPRRQGRSTSQRRTSWGLMQLASEHVSRSPPPPPQRANVTATTNMPTPNAASAPSTSSLSEIRNLIQLRRDRVRHREQQPLTMTAPMDNVDLSPPMEFPPPSTPPDTVQEVDEDAIHVPHHYDGDNHTCSLCCHPFLPEE